MFGREWLAAVGNGNCFWGAGNPLHGRCCCAAARRSASLPVGLLRVAVLPAAGDSAGRQLQGILEDGVVKFLDRSAFHGSIAQGDMLVRAAHCAAGIPLTDCIRMMAENPAKILGLSGKGRLLPGYDADIVLFDEQVRARSVYYRGRLVITANESKGENQ